MSDSKGQAGELTDVEITDAMLAAAASAYFRVSSEGWEEDPRETQAVLKAVVKAALEAAEAPNLLSPWYILKPSK